MKDEYEKDFAEAMKEVGVSVLRMNELTGDFMDIRFRITSGEEFLLTHNSKTVAFIRQLDKGEIEAELEKDEDGQMDIVSIEQLRRDRDGFLYKMYNGQSFILGFRNKTLAVITPEIPEKYLKQYEKAWGKFATADRKARWETKKRREGKN